MCQSGQCNYGMSIEWHCKTAPYVWFTRGEPLWFASLTEADRITLAVRCSLAVHDGTYRATIPGGRGELNLCHESCRRDGEIVSREEILSYLPK